MHKYLFAPLIAAAGFLLAASTGPAMALHGGPNVLITPLGTHDGEFCRRDRALLFEDPNGTTILYDPGMTVRGPTDERLPHTEDNPAHDDETDPENFVGELDVVLVSSVHGDHLGGAHPSAANNGTCGSPSTDVPDSPISNTAEILAGHFVFGDDDEEEPTGDDDDAVMFIGGEMRDFMRAQVITAGGASSQVQTLRPGGTRKLNDVKFHVTVTSHSNGVGRGFLQDATLKANLTLDGLTSYVGPDHGFVIQFTNGLVVYMTGDTGPLGDMKSIIKDFYGPQLAVVHLGSTFGMGPEEGAFAVKRLIQPKSVIVTHVNEEGTIGGIVKANSKTETFIDLVKGTPVHVPLSGETMEFDGHGKCVSGPAPC